MKSLDMLKCLKNKNVFLRCDFNIPLRNNQISDTFKINHSLKTIEYLIKLKPKKIILASHLGRPIGYDKELTLKPIANYLNDKLGQTIYHGNNINNNNSIMLLENLRFNNGEEDNNNKFAKFLANLSDIYINDAFAVSHRKHASVSKILDYFPDNNKYMGFLFEMERNTLDRLINDKKKPFVVILGGSKITDKIKLVDNLLIHADTILIGGALSYCFLKAKGFNVGDSPYSENDVVIAKKILKSDINNKIVLRCDSIVSDQNENIFQTHDENIPTKFQGYDIGNNTIYLFSQYIKTAKKIFWNGPLGMYEKDKFQKGSKEIIKILTKMDKCDIIIGGGETGDMIHKMNLTYSSNIQILTGGGASLNYLGTNNLLYINKY